MKKNLLLSLFLFTSASILLSQNLPFPENEAVWKETHITFAGPIEHHFALCGDTTIDGNVYANVLDLQVDSALNVIGGTYAGAIRSGGGVVRYRPNYEFDEYVLFDFNLEPGDVIDLYPHYSNQTISRTVDSVDVQLLAGQMRKVIYFKPGYSGAPVEFWIEGIGSSYGLLGRAQDPGADIGFDLLCFQHDNEYLNLTLIECFLPELENCSTASSADEVAENFRFSVSPNPVSDELLVRRLAVQPRIWDVEVLGLDGREVGIFKRENVSEAMLDVSHLPSGVYFLRITAANSGEMLKVEKFVISK